MAESLLRALQILSHLILTAPMRYFDYPSPFLWGHLSQQFAQGHTASSAGVWIQHVSAWLQSSCFNNCNILLSYDKKSS